MEEKVFQVTESDKVRFIKKGENPNVVWTGFDESDNAQINALVALEKALREVQDHAVVRCPNRKGLKAQHKLAFQGLAKTRKGVEIQIIPNDTRNTLILTRNGNAIVPPFAAFNELVTVGRYETAVGKAIELLMVQ